MTDTAYSRMLQGAKQEMDEIDENLCVVVAGAEVPAVDPRATLRAWLTRSPIPSLMVLYFVIQAGTGVVPPLLPDIRAGFRLTLAQVAMVGTAFSLSRLVLDFPLGIAVQWVNKNGLVLVSILAVGIGAFLSAQAASFPQLLIGRVIVGVGVATFMITGFLVVLESTYAGSQGRVVTVYNASGSLAYCVVAPGVAGLIAAKRGWRAGFWFGVGAACAALIITVLMLTLVRNRCGVNAKLLSGNARPGSLFLWAGISNISSDKLWLVNFLTFVFGFHFTGFIGTLVPLHLAEVVGVPVGVVGLLISAQAVIDVVFSLLAGVLFDRYDRRAVLVPGMLVLGVTSSLMLASDALIPTIACLLIMPLGRSMAVLPVALLPQIVPKERIGAALGLIRLTDDVSLTLGPIVLSWIASRINFLAAGLAVGLMASAAAAALWVMFRRDLKTG